MRKPDFFIVGAPKCGTTAMQYYLSQHPDIFMPEAKPPYFKGKELHFFGSDLKFRRPSLSEEDYLSYFREAKDEKRVGEASVWYLYSKLAAIEIKECCPRASIIIMLRNPVDMIYSLHSQQVYNRNEDITSFREALQAEYERKKGLRIPKTVHLVEGLFYRETVKFSEQVKRYFDVFGRENVQIIIFDDFKADTAGVYKNTLRFLGVDDSFEPEFKVINPNKVVRSKALREFLHDPPPMARMARKIGKRLVPKPLRQQIMEGLQRINIKYAPRPPMDPDLRHQLQEEFKPEVEKLSELLGRDLNFWR